MSIFSEEMDNFFVEIKGKLMCLICGSALGVMKKSIWSVVTVQYFLDSVILEAKCVSIEPVPFSKVWNHNKLLSPGLFVTDWWPEDKSCSD